MNELKQTSYVVGATLGAISFKFTEATQVMQFAAAALAAAFTLCQFVRWIFRRWNKRDSD